MRVSKLRPAGFRDSVAAVSAEKFKVIVLSETGAENATARIVEKTRNQSIGPPGTENLKLIKGWAVTATAEDVRLFSDSESITAIWGIKEEFYNVYVRIIKSLENFVTTRNGGRVANISLGVPLGATSQEFHPDEPMNLATKLAAEANTLVVFAAGNYGPENNTLNPWSVAPWVVSVGAATKDGSGLAKFSSRGVASDPLYRPTIVAPGEDIIGAHPKGLAKTADQKEAEARVGFKKLVPWRQRRLYSVNSGTSFAAPQVMRIASQIIYFLERMWETLEQTQGQQLSSDENFAQIYTHSQSGKSDDRITTNRLIGKLTDLGSVSSASYPIRPSAALVKQIIMDMAIPMPAYGPHEVGAGLVTRELAEHYFGGYGIVDPELASYKVL